MNRPNIDPPIHARNDFQILFQICEDIRKITFISAVEDGAKSASALSETALSRHQHSVRQR